MQKKNGENLCNQKLTLRFAISEVNTPLARSIRKKQKRHKSLISGTRE